MQQWQSPDIEKKAKKNNSQTKGCLAFLITFVVMMAVVLIPIGISSGWFSNIIKSPGTRNNPIALGQSGKYKDSLFNYRVELTITEAARGKNAEKLLENAGVDTDASVDGEEYFVAKIRIKALSGNDNEKIGLSLPYYYEVVSQSGVSYEDFSVSGFSDIYPGGETTGYLYGKINNEDNPLIGFKGSSVSNIIWFRITE